MKIARIIPATFVISAIVCGAWAQGNLTPPGAPAPSMKTLDQIDASVVAVEHAVNAVEVRIDLATVPGLDTYHHEITEPGSYYLSSHLQVTKSNGILIRVAGVTIDLNGYSIFHTSESGGFGIYALSATRGISIRNGTIRGFSTGTRISGDGALVQDMNFSNCSSSGLYGSGSSTRLINCTAISNTGTGLYVGGGSSVVGCTAYLNEGPYGIYASAGSIVKDCSAYNNDSKASASYGIYVGNGCLVSNCSVQHNSNTNSSSGASQGAGIYASTGSSVLNCVVKSNQGDGIRVAGGSLVQGNNCYGNGNGGDGAGIHAFSSKGRIEGNNTAYNDRGIHIESSGNIIVRNTASGNGTNYSIAGGNDTGTIQSSPVGAGAWDNFEF